MSAHSLFICNAFTLLIIFIMLPNLSLSDLSITSSTMSARLLFRNAFTLLVFFMFSNLSASDDIQLPSPYLTFHMENGKEEFRAGEIAAIIIKVVKDFKSEEDRHSFNPNVSVNDVMGNSRLITGLWCDTNDMKIFFIPIMVGKFNVLITEARFNVSFPAISYNVTPGPIYEPGGIVSWMGQIHDCVAGSKSTVLILPKDAFGNNVTVASEGQNINNFEVFATHLNGSNVYLLDVINRGWNEVGYVSIEFVAVTAGHQLVHIKHKNVSLIGSPFPLTVHPGDLDAANCLAHWRTETKSFQLFSRMETFISQRDKFGNLVPGLYEFDIEVMEKGSKLSLPICDLQYKEVSTGIQSFSFYVSKPGEFFLIISDKSEKKIMDMPYEFTIFTGYFDEVACDDQQLVLNGTGLNDSVAGDLSYFRIVLKDKYQYPSPIELEWLQVEITLPSLSLRVEPNILRNDFNGTQPTGMLSDVAFGPRKYAETKTNDYNVTYTAEKSGIYEIRIFVGNIPLNGGRPFIKVVSAGQVYLPKSEVVKYDKNATAKVVNYLTVQLVDKFNNPVAFQERRLNLSVASKENARYIACLFSDNYDGTYLGSYMPFDSGDHEIRITYDKVPFKSSPFGVNVISSWRLPNIRNDSFEVWEDQSTAFNALDNDEFFFNIREPISEYQMPSHGSLLQYGTLFRYTPYKGFYGSDRFLYTVTQYHNFTGEVSIHVLTNPPQFVSSPIQLQAVEDTPSPQFGGFPSFEIRYSDSLDNISLMLTAQNGTVSLSLSLMQLLDPMWDELSVSKVEGRDKCLNITGRLDVINFALKSLQYKGNANFSGNDNLAITTLNRYGEGHLDVPIYVEPINDPPCINAPKFIIVENDEENKGCLIFDSQRDTFKFFIADPDHLSFPGHESHFRVMFSVEVSSGTFSAKLPAQLKSSTETKLKRSKQWQPLQTFVEISHYFSVERVKGIRFWGTTNECNTLLHQMVYYGDKHDAVLKLVVNDMGWYGCYPDCSEMMSAPLISEATVNLIRGTPISSLLAHSLGLLIVLEFILLSLLAVILMFFTCKCVIVLSRGKMKQQAESQNIQLIELKNSNEQMSSAGSTENTNQLAGNHSSSFRQSELPPNLPKPVEETNVAEAATMIFQSPT